LGLSSDGTTPLANHGKHKVHCPDLARRNKPHMLPYGVRVIRHANGAYIENGDDIPTPKPIKDHDDNIILTKDEIKTMLTAKDIKKLDGLSHCARDHYLTVVKQLTDDQLKQKYPLACRERWGGESHHLSAKYSQKYGGNDDGVPLELLLSDDNRWGDHEPVCRDCGSDGDQWFSFCLNRPMNGGFVHHCEFCHKCFYFRAGCLMGCAHCGMGWYNGDDDPHELSALAENISLVEAERMLDPDNGYSYGQGLAFKYKEEGRGCNVPDCADSMTRGLASEGYWGY
jgi:hypothetical protein